MSLAPAFRLTGLLLIAAMTLACASSQEPPVDEPAVQKAPGDAYIRSANELLISHGGACEYDDEGGIVDIKKRKGAARLYEKAIEAGVNSDEAYTRLAYVSQNLALYDDEGRLISSKTPGELNQKWRKKMMETARQGLELYPDSIGLIRVLREPILRGDGYITEEEYVALTRRLRELDPDREEFLLSDYRDFVKQGRIKEAVDKYVQYVQITDADDYNVGLGHIDRAKDLAKQGHQAHALRIYDALMDLSRQRRTYSGWRWRDRRGMLCGYVSDFSLSLTDYSEFPDFVERAKRFWLFCGPKEHLKRGSAALRAGNLDLAVEEFGWQLEENPYPPRTYLYLAEAYDRLDQPEKAGEVVKRYFDFEKDVIFRCIYHDRMLRENFQQFAPDLIREVGEECRQWKAAGANP